MIRLHGTTERALGAARDDFEQIALRNDPGNNLRYLLGVWTGAIPTLPLALEARQVGKRDVARMHVHAAEFSATAKLREDLAGIEQAVHIKRTLEALLLSRGQ